MDPTQIGVPQIHTDPSTDAGIQKTGSLYHSAAVQKEKRAKGKEICKENRCDPLHEVQSGKKATIALLCINCSITLETGTVKRLRHRHTTSGGFCWSKKGMGKSPWKRFRQDYQQGAAALRVDDCNPVFQRRKKTKEGRS